MATVYMLTITGNDAAFRRVARSYFVKSAAAVAWLADPAAPGDIKTLIDSYATLTGLSSLQSAVQRIETPALPGLPGSEYRGNQVQIKGSVVNAGIQDTIRTSIPARVEANFPIVPGTTTVQVVSGGGGYDPVAFPAWDNWITAYEAVVDSEEGGDVTNIESAQIND